MTVQIDWWTLQVILGAAIALTPADRKTLATARLIRFSQWKHAPQQGR
jgi:hypothetical protein